MLSTNRLYLEPLRESHAELMFGDLQAPSLYEYHEDVPPKSLEALTRRYAFLESGRSPDGTEKWLNWIVFKHDGALPIGYFQATIKPSLCADVGYIIFPRFWGQGYGSECAEFMVQHLITHYAVRRITACVESANIASIKVLERAGLTKVRIRPNAANYGNRSRHNYHFCWPKPEFDPAAGHAFNTLNTTSPPLTHFHDLHREILTLNAENEPIDTLNIIGARMHCSPSVSVHFVHLEGRFKAVQYHRHIIDHCEVPIDTQAAHDGWNALTWLTFPATKWALMRRHCEAFALRSTEQTNHRSAQEDVLSHFDESGVIVLTTSTDTVRRIQNFAWKELFWQAREEFEKTTRVLVFGHGLAQKLTAPFLGLIGHARVELVESSLLNLAEPAAIEAIDERIANGLHRGETLRDMKALHPFPLLGVPGYWHETENAEFYDNIQYFRTKKTGGKGKR